MRRPHISGKFQDLSSPFLQVAMFKSICKTQGMIEISCCDCVYVCVFMCLAILGEEIQ